MNDIKRQYYRKVTENRDHSYDGRLYTAVKSTKIYCKPSCSAKQPLEKNVLYFLEQEQALKAGFRPCLKCKPQYSPYNNGQQDCISNFLRGIRSGYLLMNHRGYLPTSQTFKSAIAIKSDF